MGSLYYKVVGPDAKVPPPRTVEEAQASFAYLPVPSEVKTYRELDAFLKEEDDSVLGNVVLLKAYPKGWRKTKDSNPLEYDLKDGEEVLILKVELWAKRKRGESAEAGGGEASAQVAEAKGSLASRGARHLSISPLSCTYGVLVVTGYRQRSACYIRYSTLNVAPDTLNPIMQKTESCSCLKRHLLKALPMSAEMPADCPSYVQSVSLGCHLDCLDWERSNYKHGFARGVEKKMRTAFIPSGRVPHFITGWENSLKLP